MSPELWVYLDDEGGRAADLPAGMAAECRRLAAQSGLRPCGVVRSLSLADPVKSSWQFAGLEVIYVLSDRTASGEVPTASVAAQLTRAIKAQLPQITVVPATAFGADLGARIAAGIGTAFLSRYVDLSWENGQPVARRSVYDNRAHQMVSPVGEPPWIATVDPSVLDEPSSSGSTFPKVELLSDVEEVSADQETWRISARELDVLDADIVVSIGAGVSEAIVEQVHRLAVLLGGAVGGSREAVFRGLVSRDRQVGSSGKWIAPRIYIALGISGATYHMMGLRGTKHLVAVNHDAGAPIFGQAEIGIVGDVASVVPALLSALENAAGGNVAALQLTPKQDACHANA